MKIEVHFPELYDTDRIYGGPEEGGWWWDRYTLRHVFKPRAGKESTESERKALERLTRYLNRQEGNRPLSSVLSTGYIQWNIAEMPGELSTKERPIYE